MNDTGLLYKLSSYTHMHVIPVLLILSISVLNICDNWTSEIFAC